MFAGVALTSDLPCSRRVVGYITMWGSVPFKDEQAKRLTHLVIAFFAMKSNGTLHLDGGNPASSRLNQIMTVARRHKHLRVLFAIGGWENSQYFTLHTADRSRRMILIDNIIEVIKRYNFDGVDIDWEYPVTGGSVEGVPADRANYVHFLRELRSRLNQYEERMNQSKRFLVSFAGAAGYWVLKPGFDLVQLTKYVDFINVMSYDYFGAWQSKWGAFTGPPAPLYFASPKSKCKRIRLRLQRRGRATTHVRFSGRLNVDSTMKYYSCQINATNKLNMGLPFYGRYWLNVGDAVDESDEMWRRAMTMNESDTNFKVQKHVEYLSSSFEEGGEVKWRRLISRFDTSRAKFHQRSKSSFLWIPENKTFVGFESPESLNYKIDYAIANHFGGVMIWAIDFDDDSLTMLKSITERDFCAQKQKQAQFPYKCSPINEQRWWTFDDSEELAGMCGKSAPLYNGYYAVCDPDDPGHSCCGRFGYCGTGEEFCNCYECVDYGTDPMLVLKEPIKPTQTIITWYTLDAPEGKRGRCGRQAPLIDGVIPTCNPDDQNAYCCSSEGYCGNTKEHCECVGCVNYSRASNHQYRSIEWWTHEENSTNVGKCGPNAERLPSGKIAKCNPNSEAYCCSSAGYCGKGSVYCNCVGCVDFKNNPHYEY
ncbi:chitin recognition protein [Dictyocaulus viviparus]|uniref:Chitin recognition protein n=1 Tax=Dictyocaulus viviparus TaxID=29172 RepID=A0A0D8Y2E9_DICVI|nr:chitin recognition protein [Dictyocaulus viviparus]